MYCPVCFNSTLSPASNGVIRLTFNGKSKNTSQFFYNVHQQRPDEIYNKLRLVVEEYFKWYAEFQNKDTIKNVQLTSSDFVCKNGCKLNNTHKINVVGSLLLPELIVEILNEAGKKFGIDVKVSLVSLEQS